MTVIELERPCGCGHPWPCPMHDLEGIRRAKALHPAFQDRSEIATQGGRA